MIIENLEAEFNQKFPSQYIDGQLRPNEHKVLYAGYDDVFNFFKEIIYYHIKKRFCKDCNKEVYPIDETIEGKDYISCPFCGAVIAEINFDWKMPFKS